MPDGVKVVDLDETTGAFFTLHFEKCVKVSRPLLFNFVLLVYLEEAKRFVSSCSGAPKIRRSGDKF